MKTSIVACVVLGTWSTFACAQDRVEESAPAAAVQACAGCADDAGVGAQGSASGYRGEAPGGHDISVFTGQPGIDAAAAARASRAPASRITSIRADLFGPGTGADGFTLGRQYDLEHLTRPDVGDHRRGPMAGRDSDPAFGPGAPYDNGVRYFRGGVRGISTDASWTVDNTRSSPIAERAWGWSVGFDQGAFSLRAAHQNRHVARVRLYDLGGTTDAKNSIVAANLRMGWGTAYAAYSANRGWGGSPLYNPDNPYGAGVASTSSTDSRDTLAGVAVPVTRSTTLLASFIHKNDRDLANRDANQVAIGASYVLSRKTDFYAALSHTVVTNGNGILISGAAHPSGSSAVNIGMRHAF